MLLLLLDDRIDNKVGGIGLITLYIVMGLREHLRGGTTKEKCIGFGTLLLSLCESMCVFALSSIFTRGIMASGIINVIPVNRRLSHSQFVFGEKLS